MDQPNLGGVNSPEFVKEGKVLVMQHQFNDAVRICRVGLLGDPSCVDGRLVLGMALIALGRHDEVIAEMRVALDQAPQLSLAHLLRGEALARRGDLTQAQEALSSCLRLEPTNSKARALLSALDDSGDTAEPLTGPSTQLYPSEAAQAVSSTTDVDGAENAAALMPAAAVAPLDSRELDNAPATTVDPEVEGIYRQMVDQLSTGDSGHSFDDLRIHAQPVAPSAEDLNVLPADSTNVLTLDDVEIVKEERIGTNPEAVVQVSDDDIASSQPIVCAPDVPSIAPVSTEAIDVDQLVTPIEQPAHAADVVSMPSVASHSPPAKPDNRVHGTDLAPLDSFDSAPLSELDVDESLTRVHFEPHAERDTGWGSSASWDDVHPKAEVSSEPETYGSPEDFQSFRDIAPLTLDGSDLKAPIEDASAPLVLENHGAASDWIEASRDSRGESIIEDAYVASGDWGPVSEPVWARSEPAVRAISDNEERFVPASPLLDQMMYSNAVALPGEQAPFEREASRGEKAIGEGSAPNVSRASDAGKSGLLSTLSRETGRNRVVIVATVLGVLLCAAGIGFVVRSFWTGKHVRRKQQVARKRVRQGNIADYMVVARMWGHIAKHSDDPLPSQLAQAVINELVPIEFGVEPEIQLPPQIRKRGASGATLQVVRLLNEGKLQRAREAAFNARESGYADNGLLQYLTARIKLLDGDGRGAITHLERADQLRANDTMVIRSWGEALCLQGDFAAADDQFQRALKLNRKHISTLVSLSRCMNMQGQSEKALSMSEEILSSELQNSASDGQIGRALVQKAYALARLGRKASAEDAIRQARMHRPLRDPVFLDDVASTWLILGRLRSAERALTGSQAVMKNRAPLRFLKARVLQLRGRRGEALALLDKETEFVAAQELRVRLLIDLGRVAQAKEALRTMRRQLSPSLTELLHVDVLIAEENYGEAAKVVDQALARRPKNIALNKAKVRSLMGLGEFEAAKTLLDAIAEKHPREKQLALSRVDLDLALGDFSGALKRLERLRRRHPDELRVLRRLARLYLGKRDLGRAEQAYLEVLKRAPRDTQARYQLAGVHLEARRFEAVKKAIADLRTDATGLAHLTAAELSLAREAAVAASSSLEKARSDSPDNVDVWVVSIRAEIFRDRIGVARSLLKQFQERFGKRAELYQAIGEVLLAAGDKPKAALKAFKTSLRKISRRVRYPVDEAQLHVLSGRAHQETGTSALALVSYRKAAALCPLCPEPQFRIGLALDERGETREALVYLKKARTLAPKQPQIYYELGKVYENDEQPKRAIEMYTEYLKRNPPREFAREVRQAIDGLKES